MSIPRVVPLVMFGLISSVGPAEEPVVKAASPQAAATQAQKAPPPVIVRIIVVPRDTWEKGQAAIQNWLQTQSAIRPIQPWDVIVVGKEPWLFIHDTLVPHDHTDYHFELGTVHLSVSRRDHVRWESDREFCIIGIGKDKDKPTSAGSPDNPFQLKKETCTTGKDFWIESGPLAHTSAGQRYKTTFRINGQSVDPDIVCEI